MNTETAAPAAPTTWIAALPYEVRFAIAACEDAGVGVDEYSTGCNTPVFYEVEADFLACSNSLGAVMSMVNRAIRKECERYGIDSEHISAIERQVRHDALAGSYHEGLNKMMCWVGIATYDED